MITPKQHLLFICSANMMRSPTAEDMFCDSSKYEVRSAGILDMAPVKITQQLIDWADIVFVFSEKEDKHLTYLNTHFNLVNKRVIDLNIPNIYTERGALELVRILKEKLKDIL